MTLPPITEVNLANPESESRLVWIDSSLTRFPRWVAFPSEPAIPHPKTCLSCGAIQDPYGNLPCGH